ncbi:MAG: hydrogenase, partial [Campylobacterales bacterium]
MPSKPSKPRLLWLQGVTCNGNSHSFLNLPYLAQLLERFDLLYHPLLPSLETLESVVRCNHTCEVLVFEGAFDPQMTRAGRTLSSLVEHYGAEANHIIAAGSCASFGGVLAAAAPERSSGLAFREAEHAGPIGSATDKLINIPGCPAHPEWLGHALMMVADGQRVAVDALRRPKAL